MTDQPNENDVHREASEELEDAMLHLSIPEVLKCLKRLDRLDGEPLRILVGQLDGSIPQQKFRNRFQRVPNMSSRMDLPQYAGPLILILKITWRHIRSPA